MTTNGMRVLAVVALVAALAACGGGNGSEPAALPPPVAAAPVIGAAGGSTSEASGATVTVPAGALASDTTIRVAIDSSGAPPLPAGLLAAGNTYVITPHGGEFAQSVEVRIPAPNVTLQPNQELRLAKAQPGGEWEVLAASQLRDGKLVAQVDSFSFFVPVTVTYILPLAQLAPFAVTSSSLDCQGQDCQNLVGTASATFSVTTNNGQLPANCPNAVFRMATGINASSLGGTGVSGLPLTGGSITRNVSEFAGNLYFVTGLYCAGPQSHYLLLRSASVQRASLPSYPRLAVLVVPAQLDVVAGLRADLDAVLSGGASKFVAPIWATPTATNRAEIDWQRSDDGGNSWRVVAHSFQNEAAPTPMGSTVPWSVWSVRHGFVASAADQGALIRVRACYTPPDVPAPPCVTGAATRINVLQQSALPTIVDAPRSVLVRTGQTASFSATASAAPAPTLQWQSRAANATGAWTDVSTGTGATTGSYTTAVTSTADNGTQYRVLAVNALGSAASAVATVSVSELDVAPTISTQPAGLGVTVGDDAAFAVAARGTEALSYQWSKDGVALNGANSPVLRLPAVNAGQAGSYRVTVSNAAGTVTSDAALLTLSAGAPAAVAPTIVTQPVSVLVNAGNTATFAVGASGSGTLNYQWLRNGQPIAGATAAFFSIAQAAVGDAATYAVQVSNGVGAPVTSFNVTLTVNASAQATPVALLTQPSAQVQSPGGSATFAVAASGSAPISYQWLKNGAPIAGATSAVLTLIGVNGSDAANYSVTVSNPLLSVTSAPASLTVLGAPTITAQPAATSVSAGSSATFNVTASGSALLYQWTRNGVAIAGATSASHTTAALTLADSGAVYAVFVFNGAGLAFGQGAVLSVTPAPVSIGGSVSGLTGSGLVLQNNAGDNLAVAASGAFSFATGVAPGTPYAVTVLSQPSGQSCAVQNGSGTASAAVSNVVVSCGASGSLALVTNYLSNSLSILRANATTGALTLLGSVATGANPYAVAVSPNGLYAYVGNLIGGSISAYAIDRASGTLAPIPSGSRVSNNPYSIALDPLGRFLWVANYGFNTVSAFAIGQDGALAAVGAPLATGALPRTVAVHPNGNFVYVAGESSHSIAVYAVDAATGALTLRPGTVANSVLSPNAMVMHPNGTLAYVADGGSGAVAAFNVNASTGVLSVKGYFNTGSGTNAVALHPSGQFLYASTSSGVMLFAVTATGSLNVVGAATPAGTVPKGLALDGAGTHLYVTDLASGTVSAFAIDAATGALSPLGAALATGGQPSGVAITP